MKKPTRNDIRQAALDITRYFVAIVRVADNASVVRHTRQSDVGPIPGWLVQCQVFVPEDHFDKEGG